MTDPSMVPLRTHVDQQVEALRRELELRAAGLHEALDGVRGQMFAQNAHTRDQLVDMNASIRELTTVVRKLEVVDAADHGGQQLVDREHKRTARRVTRATALLGAASGIAALVKSFVGV